MKLTREKIALVAFFALVIAGGCILLSYFSTGRGWSVAATAVDDSVGQLDRYTAIVYSGVAEPDPASEANAPGSTGEVPISATAVDPTESDKETGLGFRLLMLAAEVDGAEKGRVFVSDVRELYEQRGANVLTLDLSDDGQRYAEPIVLDSGDKKVGVFSVKDRLPVQEFEGIVEDLRADGADSVLCITPRPSLISSYEGVDVVLVTHGAHEYAIQNEPDDGTVVATSPLAGDVGVILLSSNNIPSVKSVESL